MFGNYKKNMMSYFNHENNSDHKKEFSMIQTNNCGVVRANVCAVFVLTIINEPYEYRRVLRQWLPLTLCAAFRRQPLRE